MLLSIFLTTRRLTTVRSHRTHLNIKSCILNIKYILICCDSFTMCYFLHCALWKNHNKVTVNMLHMLTCKRPANMQCDDMHFSCRNYESSLFQLMKVKVLQRLQFNYVKVDTGSAKLDCLPPFGQKHF